MDDQTERKKKIKVSRNIFEHGYLNSIALNQLQKAKDEEDGHRFRWIIPSMAFSCFRIEALCNIYGSQLFPHWEHFESTSFIGKIVLISEFLKLKVDFSAEPWQTINKMKNFRNTLAHAKPQTASEVHEVPDSFQERLLPSPKAKKTILWYSSIENAERFNGVVDEMEILWMNNARALGACVDTSGARIFEVLSKKT